MSEEQPAQHQPANLPPLIPRDEAEARATLDLWQQHGRPLSAHAGHSPAYGAGVVAGLRWALGDDAEAPITKVTYEAAPTVQQIARQQSAADRLTKEHPLDQEHVLPPGMPPIWFLGVEAALAWMRSAGDPRSAILPEITTAAEFEEWVRDELTDEGLLNS
ncbi:MAG: hypothetical protein AUG49_19015 [Catenulispora sp. 13_1_20CM_3_70_7]|nr:MAG: hypothetical protein AUG49_19015 [Catenulispora sp. 13_1_20CM_3_70_7]